MLFQSLQKKGFGIAISRFSFYESLQDAQWKEKEIAERLTKFDSYEVDKKVLVIAARLSILYKNEKNLNLESDPGDLIIAATTIATGSLILTSNPNHFPRPFFKELIMEPLLYRIKNKTRMTCFCWLEPNTDFINLRFKKKIPDYSPK